MSVGKDFRTFDDVVVGLGGANWGIVCVCISISIGFSRASSVSVRKSDGLPASYFT